jgi:quinol-cytochrome oxidoreductase complex cytochrome b subunit
MGWIRERVWQMGIGILVLLAGAGLTYAASAPEPVNTGVMWIGLALIFLGALVPLFIKALVAAQEARGEDGET